MSAAELARAWSFDPVVVLILGLVFVTYTRGIFTMRPIKEHVLGPWRPIAFYVGIGSAFLALSSPIDTLSDRLFAFHMIQHLLLVFIAAPLILVGAPLLPMLRGIPSGLRRTTVIPGARSTQVRFVARHVTNPMIAWAAFVVALWGWHMPSLYTAALESETVHILEHASFIGTALLFWWLVIEPVPFQGRIPYLGRLVFIILALIQSLPLVAMLTFTSEPWYEPYVISGGYWGIDPMTDQQMGGLIMWIGAMVPYFIAVSALFMVAMNKDEADTRKRQMAMAGTSPLAPGGTRG